jgi:hypothetical protein
MQDLLDCSNNFVVRKNAILLPKDVNRSCAGPPKPEQGTSSN